MKNNKGFLDASAIIGLTLGLITILFISYYIVRKSPRFQNSPTADFGKGTGSQIKPADKPFDPLYGMKQYADSDFGFSFWHPASWQIKETSFQSDRFSGGKVVKTLLVGEEGDIYIYEFFSQKGTITDNPGAAPFPPISYSWNAGAGKWMVSWPEGAPTGESGATTTAPLKNRTISGLPILGSPSRFDTNIIPLDKNNFVIVSDRGGANADYLARTITEAGADVDRSVQSVALQQEAASYKQK
ncbi:MAG: hypothetical protein HY432_02880 [Candidatus Liptonbacteria bacterium]|nr:hypothetical protein [Candidatus Liptonbacteria bacterium]